MSSGGVRRWNKERVGEGARLSFGDVKFVTNMVHSRSSNSSSPSSTSTLTYMRIESDIDFLTFSTFQLDYAMTAVTLK